MHILTEHERAQLGISDCQVSPAQTIPLQNSAIAQGFTQNALVLESSDPLEALADQSWSDIELAEAATLGLSLRCSQENPGLTEVESLSGTELSVRTLPASSPGFLQIDADQRTVYLDLNVLKLGRVMNSDNESLVLRRVHDEIVVWTVLTQSFPAPEPLQLDAPLAEWMAASPDDWLRSEALDNLDAKDPWSVTSSVGLYARLRLNSAERSKEIVERLLQGAADDAENAPWLWAQELSAQAKDYLWAQLVDGVQELNALLIELQNQPDPDNQDWRDDYRYLLHRRDELESTAVLLANAGRKSELSALLQELDSQGRVFVRTYPAVDFSDDKLLARVAQVNPDAWWGRPAGLK